MTRTALLGLLKTLPFERLAPPNAWEGQIGVGHGPQITIHFMVNSDRRFSMNVLLAGAPADDVIDRRLIPVWGKRRRARATHGCLAARERPHQIAAPLARYPRQSRAAPLW